MKFLEFTTKVSKFPNFHHFQQHNPNFGPFRTFTSIRKIIRSVLKRVATGSVSKRYQTSLFAQLSKTSLENVNFDLICPIFNIQKPPSKIFRYEVHQQQLNSVSDGLILKTHCRFMLEKFLQLTPELSKLFPIFDTSGETMCDNITNRDRSTFLNLRRT